MIVNQPTYQDFEMQGIQCLCQAFDLIFKIRENLYDHFEEEIISKEVNEDNVWKYHKGAIMTSFILLHQGIEAFMKSEISKQSPLFLIDNSRSEWPTLPDSKNKDYDEFQTISGDKLLKTYCAVIDISRVNKDFVQLIDEIRIIRNRLVHSVAKEDLSYKVVIEKILDAFTYFFGKDQWTQILKKVFVDDPLFGFYDMEIEEALFIKRMDFAQETIGVNKLSKHFTINIKARRYYCPKCHYGLHSDFADQIDSKWAFLFPNTPTSTTIKCIVCQGEYKVIRLNCQHDQCKGNVIADSEDHDEYCLTCFNISE